MGEASPRAGLLVMRNAIDVPDATVARLTSLLPVLRTIAGREADGSAMQDTTIEEQVPDAAQIVDCKDEHRFEVADRIDMRTFPGTEYGPDAAPPSEARIRQISQEQCQAAARQYLGAKYDPNGFFSFHQSIPSQIPLDNSRV